MEHEEKDCRSTKLKCVDCGGARKASDRECTEWEWKDKIRIGMAIDKIGISQNFRREK